MGRRPEGEQALSGAERQARYRARHRRAEAAPVNTRQKPVRTTRIARWRAAVDALLALQAEYAGWLEAMPAATHDSPTGQVLQAIVELDLEDLLAVQLPRGFGRD